MIKCLALLAVPLIPKAEALIAAFVENKTIVDESATRTAITEVTAE